MPSPFIFGICAAGGGAGGAELTVGSSSATPVYNTSITITATPTGITPTSYTFVYPSDSIGNYTFVTQAGNSLAITTKTYGATEISVTATDGADIVYGKVSITVANPAQLTTFLSATAIADATIEGALRTLIMSWVDYGIWQLMDAVYPIVGGTATTHKYNLVNAVDSDGAYRIVFGGGITHNATGMLFNGTNGYGDTKLPNNLAGQNDLSFGFYNGTAGAAGYDMSAGATPRTTLCANQGGSTIFESNNGAGTTPTTPPASVLGLWVCNRVNATYSESYLNGKGWRQTAAASSAPTTTNFFLAQFSGGGVNSARSFRLAFIGRGMTATQIAQQYVSVLAFETTLSRN